MLWSRAAQRVLLVAAVALFALCLLAAMESRRPAAHPATDDPALTVLIDLNAASGEELEALPGVGRALAARIVEHRTTHGPFRSLEGLRQVRGIGEKTIAVLRPLVKIDDRR